MTEARTRIPQNLRRYVVEQDYAAYTAIDQAVWRFVLLQTHARLCSTAHPAYRNGLAQTGISVEKIPKIAEMDACLARFGWSAVCVDGFIPPRAFQEFQAAGILPIAAGMRSKDHLVYTPAPDILHEAAGHAPILPDPMYAAYLRRIGEVGKRAFSSTEDAAVYAAIFALSEIKEAPGVNAAQVRDAEMHLERTLASVSYTSEASRMSRLYWWTAEYGLVGRTEDYKIYGAGLLSSLWESFACHEPSVKKLPLTSACVDVAYDITREQPQLFVARDFEQLFEVLDAVDGALAYRQGGSVALAAALRARELATFEFAGGAFVVGTPLRAPGASEPSFIEFEGRIGFGSAGALFAIIAPEANRYRLPLGAVRGSPTEIATAEIGQHMRLAYHSGVEVEGVLAEVRRTSEGRVAALRLCDYRLSAPGADGFAEQGREYWVVPGLELRTAYAGSSDESFFEIGEASHKSVPKHHTLVASEERLLALYEEAQSAHRSLLGSRVVESFDAILRALRRDHPDEWLLRWNLLESLLKLGERGALSAELKAELAALELRFAHRQPIASGLRYLSALAA
jgi:phenylalanine-4-hydroxylase